jgi:hypothetical protein
MAYYVTPYETVSENAVASLAIGTAGIDAAVRATWPNAVVRDVNHLGDCFVWECTIRGDTSSLLVQYRRDGGAVVFDGPHDACIAFAVWLRARIPAAQRLMLFDSTFEHHVELTADCVIASLTAAWQPAA